MKNILFAGMAIVLLAMGCNKAIAPTNNSAPANNNNSEAPNNLQTYRNASYNFEFQYPPEFSFTEPAYASLEQKIVQVTLPHTEYPGTNFGDAAVSVSIGSASTLQQCLSKDLPENATKFDETQEINGTTFYFATGKGAGAGNIYDTRIFRTLRNGSCFEIIETLHTGNIGNYDPGTVKEVAPTPIWERLYQVLGTFKFTA
jgi:hypothetical protein